MMKEKISYLILATTLSPISLYAISFQDGSISAEFGGYTTSYHNDPLINIIGLVGNKYKSHNKVDTNLLVGINYLLDIDTFASNKFRTSYGLSSYYMGRTKESGKIFQELIFPNLSYKYNVSHFSIYATTKIQTLNLAPAYDINFNLGVGPNFISSYKYSEKPLDNVTIPNNSFTNQTTTNLSFNLGFGLKINKLLNGQPLECGYKFFYLGEGSLKKNNSQIINKLKTGTLYANALTCTFTVA